MTALRIEPDAWVRSCLEGFPPSLRSALAREWSLRRNRPLRPVDQRVGISDDGREAAANTWLREICEKCQFSELKLDAPDADICEFARECAARAQRLDWIGCMRVPLERVRQFVEARGLKLPEESAKITEHGVRARVGDELWWRRNLRGVVARKVEALAINLRTVHRRRELFCGADTLRRHTTQRRRNAALLETLTAINELGQEFLLSDLAALSVSNPNIRRAELMVRVAGFECVAREVGHVGEFVTITAPSKYHAHHAHDGSRNEKWEGALPRDTQNYLLRVWGQITAALARAGIKIYGFRVAEPHHDATPHFHGLFFLDPTYVMQFRRIVARYAVREDRAELGLHYAKTRNEAIDRARVLKAAGAECGALPDVAKKIGSEKAFWDAPPRKVWHRIRARVHFERIDWTRGSAAGYIAKYITKNIDGARNGEESMGADFESDGEAADAKSSAPRVLAWASTWHIRQFQQVGGPPVTVWREMRRLKVKDAEEGNVLLRAAEAADKGNWAHFVVVMGGWEARRKDMPVGLAREEVDKPNRYGEVAQPTLIGVIDKTTGQLEVTRLHEWVLKSVRPARPWTRVNNSTFPMAGHKADNCEQARTEHNIVLNAEQFAAWAHEWAAPPHIVAELSNAAAQAERNAEISRLIKQANDLIARIEPREIEPRPPTPPRRTRRDRYAKADTFSAQLAAQVAWLDAWTANTRPAAVRQ